MKNKKFYSIVLVLAMMLSMVSPAFAAVVNYGEELENMPSTSYAQRFSDVPKSYWAFGYIAEMVERGVLSGYPDGYFRPDRNVTRAEFAKIMTSAAGIQITQPAYSSFDDVRTGDWYSPYVEAAKYYLSGYETYYGYYYMPNDMALREDIAVAMVKLKGYDTTGYDLSVLQAMFTDWQSISSDARKYVAIAVEKGLISGYDDSTFRGQDSITRAEAATLLWRAYQYGNDNKSFAGEASTPTPAPTTSSEPASTPVPTVAPQVTPPVTPTAEAKRLPYKVDSLGTAAVSDTYLMATQDGSDNLYYYDSDDNTVYRMNMNTGKKTALLDVSSLTYEVYKDEEQEVTETVTKKVPRTVIEDVPIEQEETEEDNETDTETEEITDTDGLSENDNDESITKPKTKQVETTVYDEIEEEVTSIKTVSVLQGKYKNYEVGQLYYNTGNDKLLLVGKFKTYKSEKSYNDRPEVKSIIYEINNGDAMYYSECAISTSIDRNGVGSISILYGILGNMDNGNVFINSRQVSMVDLANNKTINDVVLSNYERGGLIFFYSLGQKIYCCSRGCVYEYNFAENKLKRLWDDSIGDGSMIGINNKIYYNWDIANGNICKISSDGEPILLKFNTKTDIEVNDFFNMPNNELYKNIVYAGEPTVHSYGTIRMFITNNESFIFYDTAAAGGTWRKIEKQ